MLNRTAILRPLAWSRPILTHRRLSRLAEHQRHLDEYFSTTTFAFEKEEHLQTLKRCMSLIYLRQHPIMSIDVEAYERNKNKVTEIGISVFQDSNAISPSITNVHLLIKENIHLRNGTFVLDNKSRFVGGPSYVMTLQESQKFLNQVVQTYLVEKNGVLVGHGVENDLRWLRNSQVDFADDIPTVDTLKLFHISRNSGGALTKMLKAFRIPHAYLHNAGNDAYYTLLSAFALCDPDVRRAHNLDTFERIEPVKKEKSSRRMSEMRSFDTAARILDKNGEGLFKELFSAK